MTSVAIISAIYGNYEATAKRLPPDLDVPALMFTDRADLAEQAREAGWHTFLDRTPYSYFVTNPANGDPEIVRPMLAHKWWKTHPHFAMRSAWRKGGLPEVVIWLDGSMEISVSGPEFVARCLEALGDDDLSLMPHPWRKCVFDEAAYSATLITRYDPDAMNRQAERYRDQGHPADWGLFATGHMVTRLNARTEPLGEDWWTHNVELSHQDQLSLPVLVRQYADEPGDERLRWNARLPWHALWRLHPHGA